MNLVWLLLANVASIAAIQWVVATWLKARLEASIQHEYDRRLERFRTKEAIVAEIARRRVEVLADIWTRISTYEEHLFAHTTQLAHLMLEALRAAGHDVPKQLPTTSAESMRLLAQYRNAEWDDETNTRIEQAIAPQTDGLLAEADELKVALSGQRFWLGSQIDRELREYLDHVTTAFSELTPSADAMKAFTARYRDLVARRADASNILEKLGLSVS